MMETGKVLEAKMEEYNKDPMKGLSQTAKMNLTTGSTPWTLTLWVIEKIKVGVCHFGQGYQAC